MGLLNYRNVSSREFAFHPNLPTLRLNPLSEILDSDCNGNYQIGMYSSVNRCLLGIGGAVGVSSYISDSEIGPYAMIGSRVSIGGFEHPKDWLSIAPFQWGQGIEHWEIGKNALLKLKANKKPSYKRTILGADCWVGNNAIILSGIEVGIGAIVGAGSIVTKDVPPYAIVVGNPARVVGYRFEAEQVKKLIETAWWDLPPDMLINLDFSDVDGATKEIKALREGSKDEY